MTKVLKCCLSLFAAFTLTVGYCDSAHAIPDACVLPDDLTTAQSGLSIAQGTTDQAVGAIYSVCGFPWNPWGTCLGAFGQALNHLTLLNEQALLLSELSQTADQACNDFFDCRRGPAGALACLLPRPLIDQKNSFENASNFCSAYLHGAIEPACEASQNPNCSLLVAAFTGICDSLEPLVEFHSEVVVPQAQDSCREFRLKCGGGVKDREIPTNPESPRT